jgi:hypothetical protein
VTTLALSKHDGSLFELFRFVQCEFCALKEIRKCSTGEYRMTIVLSLKVYVQLITVRLNPIQPLGPIRTSHSPDRARGTGFGHGGARV